jgi:hypothetical protein
MWSVLERAQEGDSQMVSVAAVSVSSWHRRRWRWPAHPTRNRGAGELDLEREKGLSAERERERGKRFPRLMATFTVCRRSTLARALSNGERGWVPWWQCPVARERDEVGEMSSNGQLEREDRALYGWGRLSAGCTSSVTVG